MSAMVYVEGCRFGLSVSDISGAGRRSAMGARWRHGDGWAVARGGGDGIRAGAPRAAYVYRGSKRCLCGNREIGKRVV